MRAHFNNTSHRRLSTVSSLLLVNKTYEKKIPRTNSILLVFLQDDACIPITLNVSLTNRFIL